MYALYRDELKSNDSNLLAVPCVEQIAVVIPEIIGHVDKMRRVLCFDPDQWRTFALMHNDTLQEHWLEEFCLRFSASTTRSCGHSMQYED